MPRNVSTSIENNFTAGFVTQATALNFPENAAFDQDNVVFSERGIVSRRPGMEFENNYVTKTLNRTNRVQTTFHWKNASGDGLTNLVVQQNGDTLYFYNTSSLLSLSAGVLAATVTLSSFKATSATTANLDENECQFSSGLGYLFVVHPYCDPFYVKYNSDATLTSSLITFYIRDLTGAPESVLVDNRPTTLTENHEYNLYNQGWDAAKIATFFAATVTKYPSNADVWWIFKDSTDVYSPSTTLASNSRGSTSAPKGFFRINPWVTARVATSLAQAGVTTTLTGTYDETSGTLRPSVTEFHAGRVFYAGVNAAGYTSRIYFSKIVQEIADAGLCMSSNDPTSETVFDFLPSDGGIISIPEAGTIHKLVSLGSTLLVFGANGVWGITGSVGVGFAATDYTVARISFVRSISGSSFVQIDDSVAWWNANGINILNQGKDGFAVQSMSDGKIKDFFVGISAEAKRFAKGAYNPRTHTLQWLYRSASFASITDTYTYDSVLNFNTLVGAWYTWSVPVDTVSLNSVIVIEGSGSITGSETVVDNAAATVVDNAAATVTTYGFSRTSVNTTTKYLVSYPSAGSYKFTFSECFNVTYTDWYQYDSAGTDYTSYVTTGYRVKTQGQRRFQSNYIYIFSDLEDGENSYIFQALWDYGNSGNSGRWTQTQIVNHDETYYDAKRKKLKVRGAGETVQFKFSSVTGLPFNLVGWSVYDTANSQV